jgi:hypothetical protein
VDAVQGGKSSLNDEKSSNPDQNQTVTDPEHSLRFVMQPLQNLLSCGSNVLPWLYLCRAEENWSSELVEKFRSLVQLVEGAGRLGISRYIHLKPNHSFFNYRKILSPQSKINLTYSLHNSKDYGGNTVNMQCVASITIAIFIK